MSTVRRNRASIKPLTICFISWELELNSDFNEKYVMFIRFGFGDFEKVKIIQEGQGSNGSPG